MPLISPQPHSLSLPFPPHLPAEEGLLVVLRAALAGFLRVFPASLCPAAAGSLWLCGRPSQALIVRDLLHCLPQSPQARPACSTFVFPSPQGTESSSLCACPICTAPPRTRQRDPLCCCCKGRVRQAESKSTKSVPASQSVLGAQRI